MGERGQAISWSALRSLARFMGDNLTNEAKGLLGQQLELSRMWPLESNRFSSSRVSQPAATLESC